MSIKSQKSLNEECSEIFERSYSVRSASDESLSCSSDDDECLARELMHKMTPAVISKLRRSFRKNKERSHARDIDRRVEEVMRAAAAEEGIEFAAGAPQPQDNLWLERSAFVTALENIFGHHKYTTHATKLFQLLDPFNSGKVWWRQVVARLVAAGARRTGSRADSWEQIRHISMRQLQHCKRETIVKLVSLEREDSFCYAAVSKGGRVGVYSGHLELLHSYEVFYHRTGVHRRVKNCWITDAVFLNDVQCLVVSASDRSLTFYDVTTLIHTPQYCITGLPNIPTCLAYTPMNSEGASELIFGTERGDLTRVKFLQPRLSLFHNNTPENINYYFWMELTSPPHNTYCSVATWRRVHSRSIRRVCYARDGELVLSCSHDSTVSLKIKHAAGKLDDYVFRVQRGITCFHTVPALHLLITGSCDGVVRLWETTQSSPFASLPCPGGVAVLDVACIASQEIVIAYCNNCYLHIWDLHEETLLQSLRLQFPFLGALGKRLDFGVCSIHPGPTRKPLGEAEEGDFPVTYTRRESSVYAGSTGGLMLQPDPASERTDQGLEQEPEYIRFNRSELLITCCDYVCVVRLQLSRSHTSSPLPPPADTLRARRPSVWELPDLSAMAGVTPSPRSPRSPRAAPAPHSSNLLTPAAAATPHDLDKLLENAGLQGILEKDFVLMQGLKHDLNKKLADMEANKQAMLGAVSVGAPYLALRTHEPEPMDPVDEMTEAYKRVMRLFPGSSITGTPTGSDSSTPRNTRRSSKL